MQEKSVKHFKDVLRVKEKREVILAEDTGEPWLTLEQAAARVGMAPRTLQKWIVIGVIPKPLKWSNPRVKKKLRREYVERLHDLMIIRASTTQYRSEQSVRNLCWSALFGFR